MKAETLLASSAMALFGIIFAVLAANAMAPPEHRQVAPASRAAAPPPPPPAAQPVVVLPTHTPAEATALAGLPTDVRSRDEKRLSDLSAIQAALKAYASKKGGYPSTGGAIQTACVYEKLDKACAVKSEDPNLSFVDPRGQNFGYFYASDGKAYALYALLEGDNSASDPCTGDISLFKEPSKLFCRTSAGSN
jgi:hypothetical protein